MSQVIAYDLNTGEFTRIKAVKGHKVGSKVGTIGNHGYLVIYYNGKQCLAHHLAWYITYGIWPKMLDHIDGNKLNNALSNLRETNKQLNGLNRPHDKLKGAYKVKNGWFSSITIHKKPIYLGYFATKELAHEAYVIAATNYNKELQNDQAFY